jgi:flagellar M-ring protein FliF
MDQLKKMLANLTVAQRLTIALAALAVAGGLFAFVKWRTESDFRPLYTTLAAEDAGPVVQKLKEAGVQYRLSDNGSTILVPSAKVAEVRLEMASLGLPKSGRIGFELFDKTNFGATEFVEHINYRRALEGELERTVMTLAEVEQARVHVTFPKESVYLEAREPAKASVVVRLRPGAQLVPQNVTAIQHLLASAVEGLAPESVSVLDVSGHLLSHPHSRQAADGADSSDRMLELRQNMEHDLVAKINSTLEPLLGADKFRAGASVDCDYTSGEQSEEIFDPNRSVMVSSQKSEDTSNSGGAAGVPGTASNLPRPAPRPTTSLAGTSRRTESIAFQSSRTVKHTKLPEGTVQKMSISVLVDQGVHWEGQGKNLHRVLEQPTPERLKSIRDLVAAATGFTASRGDQLIVESLPFESTLNLEPPMAGPSKPSPAGGSLNLPPWLSKIFENRLILIGVTLVVGIILTMAQRMIAKMFKAKGKATAATALSGTAQLAQVAGAHAAEIDEELELQAQIDAAAFKETTKKAAVLVRRLKDNIEKDPVVPAHIVRGWVNQ